MKASKLGLALGSAIALYVAAAAAQSEGLLTKDELAAYFAGRVVDTQTRDGVAVTFHFAADGTFRAFFNRPKNPHWSPGTWWVTDEATMCTKNDKGETICNKYRRGGDSSYTRLSASGGPMEGKWRARPN